MLSQLGASWELAQQDWTTAGCWEGCSQPSRGVERGLLGCREGKEDRAKAQTRPQRLQDTC